jgi:hypothetical protein
MHGPNFSRMFAEFVELVLPHSVCSLVLFHNKYKVLWDACNICVTKVCYNNIIVFELY